MKSILVTATALTLVLWSCERIIPFNAEDDQPLITLYSTLEPDAPLEAFVSRSVGILDQGEPILLEDATVWAEDINGQVLDTLVFIGFGQYRAANVTGVAGEFYTIKVTHSTLPSVYGQATIPAIPLEGAVDSVNFYDGSGSGLLPYKEYSFEIIDDGDPGYYMIEAYERLRGSITIPDYPISLETDDPLVNGSGFGQNNWTSRIDISNEFFLGQTHTLKIRVYQWDQQGMEILFKLKKVDEATFFYERSLDQYQNANGNPFTQPVSVYSNVQNGLGVVAGTSHRWILL
ncbi:MAG TPA: hypothetical protein DCE58_00115 [Cryomorphaceae bacterium]|nr:hypothetical protein [Cryomorphaceae bacterium]